MGNPTIVWFRQDLRIEDQPALKAAITKGDSIIPLFIWAPEEEGEWAPGGASRWWLHGSLVSLQSDLDYLGLKLILRRDSSSLHSLLEVIKETNADAVFWNSRYEPLVVKRDALIKAELNRRGVDTKIFNGSLLFEPWNIHTKQNKPYQVFTPFWKHCCQWSEPRPKERKSGQVKGYRGAIASHRLDQFRLLPSIPRDEGLMARWRPGSRAAKQSLKEALDNVIGHYLERRDEPAIKGTSELSPYLHHGEISPSMIWEAVQRKFGNHPHAEAFLRQLGWREFGYYLLYHFPHTPNEPLKTEFSFFPWHYNKRALHAWQKGETGFPIVDAGMRQLWRIGWMHNRVRLIVGSFLVKDLLIEWLEGAKWFWDTLVDADLANNTLGWQWVSGCGADAAPYFRIFNPMTQGEKFDPNGEYVRQWVPEIRALPNKWIHRPWEAPEEILRHAGIILGKTYPKPIVNHVKAREEALEAFAKITHNQSVKGEK